MPQAWSELRQPSKASGSGVDSWRWLRSTRELLEVFDRLARALLESSPQQSPLCLLEPGDTQDAPANRQRQRSGREVMWLLRCGLFGLCVSAPSDQLRAQGSNFAQLLRRLLPQGGQDGYHAADWEANSEPNLLCALVQSGSFVGSLLGGETMSASPTTHAGARGRAQRALLQRCHQWRLEAFGIADDPMWSESGDSPSQSQETQPAPSPVPTAPGARALLPPALFRAVFAGAPRTAMAIAMASLVADSVATRPAARGQASGAAAACSDSATLCLQHMLAFSMLAPLCIDDLFRTLRGNMYLRLFERYSQRNLRVASVAQLLLHGMLRERVRLLLPKLLPPMVLNNSMETIQDLCTLLEESVQSLFTPQLPYILSAVAQQPVHNMAGAFMFILERVYSNQMTIANICDASLGKVLVLILWHSAKIEDEREAHARALSAVDNIVCALRAKGTPAQKLLQQEQARKRPGTAGTAGGPPRKRRSGRGGEAIDVADEASPDVVQTLENSFLHVLDILEIVFTGNQQSPKWAEYSPLLKDPSGGEAMDFGRLFAAIALLLGLVSESLHGFAPKVLELLQSATVLSGYQPESVRCWQLFVRSVGIVRLRPLIPAVAGELVHLANRLQVQGHGPDTSRQLRELLSSLVRDTCAKHPDMVPYMPALPQWDELHSAKLAIENTPGAHKDASFAKRLEVGVSHLESAAQQAVRRAALDHIATIVVSQRSASPTSIKELETRLLARLMHALLKFLWESSAWPHDQLKCGQLLGMIGAIDPSRFSHVDLGKGKAAKAPEGVGNTAMLAKAVLTDFLVPNLTSKNAYAFAVQEILKYLQSNGASNVLQELKEDVRETLRPYLHSSYQLVGPDDQGGGRKVAQLLGDASSLEAVVAQAVALVQGKQRALFEACLPAVHGNHALALFLMHHVLHDLLHSNTPLQELGQLADSLARLLDSPRHETAQAVFSLVDDIAHRREQLLVNSHVATRAGDTKARDKHLQRIEQLRQPLTHRKVAAAAMRCGAHARALQFLEEAIIEEHQQQAYSIV